MSKREKRDLDKSTQESTNTQLASSTKELFL